MTSPLIHIQPLLVHFPTQFADAHGTELIFLAASILFTFLLSSRNSRHNISDQSPRIDDLVERNLVEHFVLILHDEIYHRLLEQGAVF